MNTKFSISLLTLLLLGLPLTGFAQEPDNLWVRSSISPEGYHDLLKICIAANESGTTLFLGTTHGIFSSQDFGKSWQSIGSPEVPVQKVIAKKGMVYGLTASNQLIIYDPETSTWTISHLCVTSNATDFLVGADETIYLTTGYIETQNEVGLFRGEGVYYSKDRGISWIQANTGVPENHYSDHLAEDQQGRIFLSYHEYGNKDGVIVYSTDQGTTWAKLPRLQFNWGDGPGPSDLTQIMELKIDQHDSIYVAFTGGLGNIATSGTIKNSFEGAVSGAEWTHMRIVPYGYDWMYLEAHDLFFASNGDRFASRMGSSLQSSGSFVSLKNQNFTHEYHDPIQLNDGSHYYNPSTYVEVSNGSIVMVQMYDQHLYFSNQERRSVLANKAKSKPNMQIGIYPNPTQNQINILFGLMVDRGTLKLYNLNGQLVTEQTVTKTSSLQIPTRHLPRGTYIINLETAGTMIREKVVLY